MPIPVRRRPVSCGAIALLVAFLAIAATFVFIGANAAAGNFFLPVSGAEQPPSCGGSSCSLPIALAFGGAGVLYLFRNR